MDDIQTLLTQVLERLKHLESKRISQNDVLPDAIKMRMVGEGVRFVRSGKTANKPVKGETPLQGASVYFDETTNKLYIWNKTTSAWISTTLS